MKTIHKFVLSEKVTTVPMPIGAKAISVVNQLERCVIYAEVDTSMPTEDRVFHTLQTGGNMLENCDYTFLGTVTLKGTTAVVHVYEIKPKAVVQNMTTTISTLDTAKVISSPQMGTVPDQSTLIS